MRKSSSAGATALDENDFTVYVRQAGTDDFTEYNASTRDEVDEQLDSADVTHDINTDDTVVTLEGDNTWGDLSPADEVVVNVGNNSEIASFDGPLGNTDKSNYIANATIGNITVETASGELDQSDASSHNSRSSAQRVYQGQNVRFNAESADTPILLRNVETGEIVLDGSTGESSSIVFDSADLESGTTYRLIFDEGDATDEASKFFNVTSLRLSASLDEDGTMFEHNEDAEITVSGSAIRGDAPVAITVEGEDTERERISFDNRGEFEETFNYQTDLSAGDYSVTVTDVRTGAEVTAGEFSVDSFPTASSASFGGGVFEEERGDVVEIPINLRNSEEGAQATVQVGSKGEVNYVTNVTVADEDGDGEVVLEWNTYMSGTNISERIFSAQGADNVTNFGNESGQFVQDLREAALENDELNLANADDQNISYAQVATIDAASYDLAVVANDEDDDLNNFNFTDVDEDDVGAVSINSRSTESSDVWVVPAGKTDQVDAQFIDENTDNTEDDIDGNLTQSDQATTDELIVHQVSASGLEGILRNRTDAGANATVAFLSEDSNYVNDQGLENKLPAFDAGFEELDVQANREARSFNLDKSNTLVIPDYQNDTYYVAVKLSGVDEDLLVNNEGYNASFGFEEYDSIGPVLGGEGGGTVDSEWTYYEADASLMTNADDEVVIRNQDGQTLRGDTNVAPGTKLGLRINSQSDTSPFLTTLNTHVDEDRTFAATGDFSERGAGINFTVNVRRGGDTIGGPYDGRILAEPTSSVSFSDQAVAEENQEVRVESVTLSDGGFVAIHSGSASGDVIGVSGYLEAGTHSNVRIDLDTPVNDTTTLVAMPHLDDNSNNLYDFPEADAPYSVNGTAVTDSAEVSLDTETPTPTPEPDTDTPTDTPEPDTDTPTDTPEPDTDTPEPDTDTPEPDTDTPEPDTPTPTTADGGPGFGVAVSLIALLAAALLTARRRD
ncbi:DUF7282 domain-containing protein [Halosimplex amylolyticum]|uniref:DUF7282 domain-containing protein n=1 Tax=Halosimplex amylolyticum TaxID=3396616 RepID=UPI003F557BB4